MNWLTVPLKQVAPAQASNLRFEPDDMVWHLTLDQIESQTGHIVKKKSALAAEAGASTNVFDDGNVLYSKLRPNKVLCPNEPGIATTELVPLRPRSDLLDRRYLTYYLRSNHFLNFANVAVAGVKMPRIIMAKFWKHKIPLPPLSEQQHIVEFLDQADALRKKRAEADAKATRILPALFYKMFGDPTTNPKGLVKKKLGDLIKVRSGNFLPAKNMDPAGRYPVYGGNGINGYHSEFMFERPVIVLGRVGVYCGAIHYSEPNCWVTDNALYVAEQSKDLHPRYLAEALRVANLNQYAGRAGQPLISGSRIYPIEILVPPPEKQETFANRFVALYGHERHRQDAGDHIERLFSVLLHRAFTGDLTSKWRGTHMKELLAEMEQQAKTLETPVAKKRVSKTKPKRHAGHDIYNKAALTAYITDRCHADDRPLGRVKVAKLFYLVQRKAEIELTEEFTRRAAGPLDDDIHKFLSLARKQKWVVLGRAQGELKPVRPGKDVTKGIEQAAKVLGTAKNKVDELLEKTKDWGWRTLERWATVLHAAEAIVASGGEVSVVTIKRSINEHPEWQAKLNRPEFSDENLASTINGLREFGFLQDK